MKIIVANWKMNGTKQDKNVMISAIRENKTDNKVILCLPFTLIAGDNSGVIIGAQDVSANENGAFTGDISAQMLKNSGVEYVIVGHSERRLYHNETNAIVKSKAIMAQKHGITPIVCIGETFEEYQSGNKESCIEKMLLESIPGSSNFIVAYEPRWAIGTGLTPNVAEIANIRKVIKSLLIKKGYTDVAVLYGGSVNDSNAQQIINDSKMDGLLIGGASLKVDTFLPIIKKAN